MRNKKAKRIRNMVRRIAKTINTEYDLGSPPLFYTGETTKLSDGTTLYFGTKTNPGVPRVLKASCLKFIAKTMKRNLK